MLKTTIDLNNYLRSNEFRDSSIINSYVDCILRIGNKEDADFLLEYFLLNPFDFKASHLIPIFKKFGNQETAEKIFQVHQDHQNETQKANPEIVELLGNLKFLPVKKILERYVFGENTDYHLCKSSVFGLLNFDCKEYKELIEQEIQKCYNKNLFPEYIPALVCKLDNKEKYLEALFTLGDEYASTDCNGGILLGFSLCGEMGKKYFMKALNKPTWEVQAFSTGSIRATYMGTKNLKISIASLIDDLRKEKDADQIKHLLNVVFGLLEMRIMDYEEDGLESIFELYTIFFKWKNGNEKNDIGELAFKYNEREKYYALRTRIRGRLKEELLISNFNSFR